MPVRGEDAVLLALPHDGLGISRLLPDLDSRCQLGCGSERFVLHVSTRLLGIPACREDKPSLSEHVPYDCCLTDECEFPS